jgi:tRNA pseudouridine55 synthase
MSQGQVLIVDKPSGMTSHDVVARMRRLLKQKGLGHAGTLDPLATGVLVVLSGQATKLAPYLTADDKVYSTTIQLGVATDSLDADGAGTGTVPLPDALVSALGEFPAVGPLLERAIAKERARTSQVPPSVSAIHVNGERAHALSRKLGADAVVLPAREVRVHRLEVTATNVDASTIDLELHVDKGYYVRALARDLAATLGTVGHVSRLRRIASGAFTLEDASPLEADALRPIELADAVKRALPCVTLTSDGVTLARHGKALPVTAFESSPPRDVPVAWMMANGDLVAVGQSTETESRVLRGFT